MNATNLKSYIASDNVSPLFLQGDSLAILQSFPDCSIDCCITSPPYWQKRQYENGGIGLEKTPQEYIECLLDVIKQVKRKPRQAVVKNGAVISATGVSGIKYCKQIELSTSLSQDEKGNALKQLENVLDRIKQGELSDFRMVIRNQQRTTHSDSAKLSGRAKELQEKGFYFLFYNPKGTMPNDVWDIIPEDSQHRKLHFAPYPEELCIIPIKSTCPMDGIVLDPFSGTGTTMKVAFELGRKSIGIDISNEYIKLAKNRICQKSENCLRFHVERNDIKWSEVISSQLCRYSQKDTAPAAAE